MRLIDAEPFDFNKVIIPDGGPNFMRGYGLGAKHVCDEIAAAPTVEAVLLKPLCEWLADELHVSADCGIDHCDNCDAYDGTLSVKVCWMKLIKEQVMEEHNGTDNP